MAYLNKNDEKRFFEALPYSEMILDNIFENLLSIRNKKQEVIDNIDIQKKKILSTLEGYPKVMDKIPANISILKEKGFCFDVNIFLVKLCGIYTTGTAMKKNLSSEKFISIGSLYYQGEYESFIDEMINLFKEVKVNINNVINGQSVMTFNMTENDIQQLIENRKQVNWFIRNMKQLVEAYTVPVSEEILSNFNQDKLLLLLSHLAISNIIDDIQKDKLINDECAKFCKIYAAYVNYRRKENPNYNPSYNYMDLKTGVISLISADSIFIQNKEFCENLDGFGSEYCITEDELLDFLPDLKRNLKIKQFRKEIELSWEFLPEKQNSDSEGKRMPLFKNHKTEEEKKAFEDKKDDLLEEKIELFSTLPYVTSLKGMNRFEGYVAYMFENGRVILEKFYKKTKHGLEPTYNEAIYVMNISDFQELSKMGKTEIREYAKDAGLNVRVINHSKNFKQRVINEVNSIAYTDDVMSFVDELVSNAKKTAEKII